MVDLQGLIEWTDKVSTECSRLLPDPTVLSHLDEAHIGKIIMEAAFDEDCTVEQAALRVIESAGIELDK